MSHLSPFKVSSVVSVVDCQIIVQAQLRQLKKCLQEYDAILAKETLGNRKALFNPLLGGAVMDNNSTRFKQLLQEYKQTPPQSWYITNRHLLLTPEFWKEGLLSTSGETKKVLKAFRHNWQQHGALAHISSVGLHELAFLWLPKLEDTLKNAQKKLVMLWQVMAHDHDNLKENALKRYAAHLKACKERLALEKSQILQAMFARLLVAHSNGDLTSDDLLMHAQAQFKQWNLLAEPPKKSFDKPCKTLTVPLLKHFYQTIQLHGTADMRTALKSCVWKTSGSAFVHQVQSNKIIRVPVSLTKLIEKEPPYFKRLFAGSQLRHAFLLDGRRQGFLRECEVLRTVKLNINVNNFLQSYRYLTLMSLQSDLKREFEQLAVLETKFTRFFHKEARQFLAGWRASLNLFKAHIESQQLALACELVNQCQALPPAERNKEILQKVQTYLKELSPNIAADKQVELQTLQQQLAFIMPKTKFVCESNLASEPLISPLIQGGQHSWQKKECKQYKIEQKLTDCAANLSAKRKSANTKTSPEKKLALALQLLKRVQQHKLLTIGQFKFLTKTYAVCVNSTAANDKILQAFLNCYCQAQKVLQACQASGINTRLYSSWHQQLRMLVTALKSADPDIDKRLNTFMDNSFSEQPLIVTCQFHV